MSKAEWWWWGTLTVIGKASDELGPWAIQFSQEQKETRPRRDRRHITYCVVSRPIEKTRLETKRDRHTIHTTQSMTHDDWTLKSELEGCPQSPGHSVQTGVMGEAAPCTPAFKINTYLVSAASNWKEGLYTWHLRGYTDDVPKVQYQGWFIFTNFTVPIGMYEKLQITESNFPQENIDKNTDIRAVFPSYVHTFLSNIVCFFPPTLTTLKCSFLYLLLQLISAFPFQCNLDSTLS